MMSPGAFFELLKRNDLEYFAGVPDSSLKHFCAYVDEHVASEKHILCANEGNAVAVATGYHLASGKMPVVYMQNSGIGNAVNPLLSIADKEVYSVPILLLIGWRGEPGLKDEPQHKKQGRVLLAMLKSMEIPYAIMDGTQENAEKAVDDACNSMDRRKAPFAIVVQKGSFEPYVSDARKKSVYESSREEAVKTIVDCLAEDDIVVSTTGMCSRELFEYRESLGQGHERDFLTVGGMGHASQIALGIALAKPERNIFCLDGDGAVIMHMGGMAISGTSGCRNFIHLILNNGVHDSVGGQATAGFDIDFIEIARSSGYTYVARVEKKEDIQSSLARAGKHDGPSLIEIRVASGSRSDLGRPTSTPSENKEAFMKFLARNCS